MPSVSMFSHSFCQLYSFANWTGTYHCLLFIKAIANNRASRARNAKIFLYLSLHVYISLANLTCTANLALGSDLLGRSALRLAVTVMLMPFPLLALILFCLDLNYQSEKDGLIELIGGKKWSRCTAEQELKYWELWQAASHWGLSDARLTSKLETLCVNWPEGREFTFDICRKFQCR